MGDSDCSGTWLGGSADTLREAGGVPVRSCRDGFADSDEKSYKEKFMIQLL